VISAMQVGIVTHKRDEVHSHVCRCFLFPLIRSSFRMASFIILLMLFTSTLAALPPIRTHPRCVTPPDRHHVSTVRQTCDILLNDFVEQFQPAGNILHWTPIASELGTDVVHLPKTEFGVNANRTHACLLEIVDSTGVGDSYPATSLLQPGLAILQDCFSKDKCGLVPLPPHYTTDLFVCGSSHRPNETLSRSSTREEEIPLNTGRRRDLHGRGVTSL